MSPTQALSYQLDNAQGLSQTGLGRPPVPRPLSPKIAIWPHATGLAPS